MLSKLRLPWALLMGLALLFGFTACDGVDDDDLGTNEDKNIVEVATEDSRFSMLVDALVRTGLDDLLDDENSDFTVFAPTNDAFNALGIDLSTLTDQELENILLYHVFADDVRSGEIQEGKTYLGTAANIGPNNEPVSIVVERSGSTVTINDAATVVEADIVTENGVIHAINTVLMPLDIVGHVMANDDFSQLATALGNASGDLVSTLSADDQTFTVFAPTDAAFAAVSDVVAGLTADELASVLTYHVVAGANATSSTLTDGQSFTTVQGENFTIDIDGNNVTITDAQGNIANVIFVNVQGTNGVVHVIDKVIMPNNL
ncbi:fasciclin domain-containing protein [Flavilitoribacter nigricans]|uniref:FAS1 domain-containing protein n=1 Tax=Flavilitoribacter nigricans (strain ATCC 23147 / DSM 23189 / NBRC 102662 / NCIMB 1420 / SS-2) TaxID=1122177 RepID=A0A2D0N6L4_FLAN2|nr:fasciclin domain-containing protein [Flavilitoribacter nigricans]PHN04097.1 hypothetical protein CRP01_23150 [Flavilitoribacter nigricans DSM 23189 = NBRC 102662]